MSETDESDPEQRLWENGWDGHEQQQRLRMANLPFWKKLEWLEEAHRLVRQFEAQRKSGHGPSAGEASDPSKQK
jgi:hypothetical protein